MLKHTVFIRSIVCISCLFLFMVGCEQKSEAPERTGTVISKKISVMDTGEQGSDQTIKTVPEKRPATQKSEGMDTAEASSATGGVETEMPQYIPELAVGYDPKGRIDPFVPLVREEPLKAAKETELAGVDVQGKKREKRIPQTPLERIELNQLSLTAIILAPSGNRALVEESTGKGYIITKGTYIGRNEGVVTQILKDKVLVEETVESIQGDIITQEKELKLPKPPGE